MVNHLAHKGINPQATAANATFRTRICPDSIIKATSSKSQRKGLPGRLSHVQWAWESRNRISARPRGASVPIPQSKNLQQGKGRQH